MELGLSMRLFASEDCLVTSDSIRQIQLANLLCGCTNKDDLVLIICGENKIVIPVIYLRLQTGKKNLILQITPSPLPFQNDQIQLFLSRQLLLLMQHAGHGPRVADKRH